MANCDDKHRYPSKRAATRTARLCESRGDPIRAYACPDCGHWHLTSNAPYGERLPKGIWANRHGRSRHVAKTLQELETLAKTLRDNK